MSSKRQKLIDTASRLFAQHGFHATGIDTVLAQSGVAKKTLYNHFRTKNELILAVLRQHDSEFRNYFMRQVENLADTPQDRLIAIFDVAEKWFSQKNFYGCLFINAIGEFSDGDSPVREICREYKKLMRDYIRELARQAGAAGADQLAEELAILLEGAIVTAQVSQNTNAAEVAKRVAETLVNEAVG